MVDVRDQPTRTRCAHDQLPAVSPQTCGKIERLWQTLKKWPARPPGTATVEALNALLDEFRDFYNHTAATGHCVGHPAEAFTATEKPPGRSAPTAPVFVSRHTVDEKGGLYVPPYRGMSACAGRP